MVKRKAKGSSAKPKSKPKSRAGLSDPVPPAVYVDDPALAPLDDPAPYTSTSAATASIAPVRVDVLDSDPFGPHPSGSIGPLPPLQPSTLPVTANTITEEERQFGLGYTEGFTRALSAYNKQSEEVITQLREIKAKISQELVTKNPRRSRIRDAAITIKHVFEASGAFYDFVKKVYPEVMTLVLAAVMIFK